MPNLPWKSLLLVWLLALPAAAEPRLRWRWSQPKIEILGACPDSKGEKVAVVRRIHWPDGDESESEEGLAELEKRAKKEPRFQDPAVVVLKPSGASTFVDWGWDPEFTPGGDRLSYSHQALPATGLRVLADTLKGNWLEEWSESTRQHRVISKPRSGFLASPTYSADGTRLLYAIQDAVNGAWPGTVGAGVYDFPSGQAQTWLQPAKQKGLDVLVSPCWVGNQVLAIRGTPLKSGTYLSDSYRWELLQLGEAPPKLLLTLGNGDTSRAPRLESGAGRLWISSRPFDPQTGKWLAKPPAKDLGKLSPNGQRRVLTQGQVLILTDNSGKEMWRTSLPARVSGVRWSANGSYLAVICTYMKFTHFLKDELLLYQI